MYFSLKAMGGFKIQILLLWMTYETVGGKNLET